MIPPGEIDWGIDYRELEHWIMDPNMSFKEIYGSDNSIALMLVASRLKPAAGITVGNHLFDHILTLLRRSNLEVRENRILSAAGETRDLVYTRKDSPVNIDELAEAFSQPINFERVGELLGYPDCCVQRAYSDFFLDPVIHFDQKDRAENARQRIATELLQRGHLISLDHLAGPQHYPCRIDCPDTMRMGYAEFLKKHAPRLFHEAIRDRDERYREYFHQPDLQIGLG